MAEEPPSDGWKSGLSDSEQRLRLILENARGHAIFVVDLDGIILDWLASSEAVYGYAAEEMLGRTGDVLYLPEDRERGLPELERAQAGTDGKASDVRWHVRKNGDRVFINGVTTALRDSSDAVVGFLKIGQDVTERYAAMQRERQLVTEIQHRVRNTLAVIRSIVRRSVENSQSLEDLSMHLEGRIEAFARIQSAVTRDPGSGADFGSLIADELLAHATLEGKRLSIDGPDILLLPKAAETLSLAIHELVTNSIKFGALSNRRGKVRVHWSVQRRNDRSRLLFSWDETGRGRPLVEVQQPGFGFELLQRTLPYELDAETEIEFLDDGMRFFLDMPVEGHLLESRRPLAP